MKRRATLTVVAFTFGVLYSTNAFAFDAEYYTYNGFDAVLSAWQLAAAIFSNVNYIMLFFPITVAGIMFGVLSHHFKDMGGKAGGATLSWLVPLLMGITIYLALFVPKGTLHIYDPVMNKYQPVAGIPNGITLSVKLFNTIERGLVDIINTSGSPLSYTDGAGGIGFDLVNKASTNVYLLNKYLDASTTKYIEDCVMFEINRPGSTLLISDIMNNTGTGKDLWTLFQLAASPAINTTYYDASSQNGTVMGCDTAYATITTVLNDNSINSLPDLINARCSSAGFNMADIDEANRCRQILGATLQWTTGSTVNADKYFQQTAMAQKLHDVIQNGNSNQAIAAQANIGVMSNTSAMWVIANEYLPIIRAVVTCVTVGLMPFLLLFITTPIGTKSLALLAGFFVWLTAWGVADALTHTLATNYAYTYFDQIRDNGTGYAAIMLMPSAATKTLGLFGMLRMAGMVLASIVSTTLIPAGHYAMSSFASHFASPVQGQASAAGGAAMTPTGSAQAMEGYQGSRVSWGQTAAFGQDRLTMAKQFAAAKQTQSALAESSMMDKDSIASGMRSGGASGFEGATNTFATEKTASSLGGQKSASDQLSTTSAAQRTANTTMSQGGAAAFGLSQQEWEEFKTGGKVLDQKQADQLNKAFNITDKKNQFQTGMQVDFGYDKKGDISNVTGHGKLQENMEFTQGKERFMVRAGADQTVTGAPGGSSTIKGTIHDLDGTKWSDGHEGHVTTDSRGKTIYAGGTGGSEFMQKHNDVTEDRTYKVKEHATANGMETDYVNSSGKTVMHKGESGSIDRSHDERTRTIDHGQSIGHGLQMVMNKDKAMASGLTSAKNEGQRRAAITTMAQSVGNDIKEYISRTGSSRDYAKADASLNISAGAKTMFGGASIDGAAQVGGMTEDAYNTNLMNRELVNRIDTADKDASSKGLTGDAHSQFVMDKLHEHVGELTSKLVANNPDKFGASAPGAVVKDAMRNMVNKLNENK